jgi:hypothetical protein
VRTSNHLNAFAGMEGNSSRKAAQRRAGREELLFLSAPSRKHVAQRIRHVCSRMARPARPGNICCRIPRAYMALTLRFHWRTRSLRGCSASGLKKNKNSPLRAHTGNLAAAGVSSPPILTSLCNHPHLQRHVYVGVWGSDWTQTLLLSGTPKSRN